MIRRIVVLGLVGLVLASASGCPGPRARGARPDAEPPSPRVDPIDARCALPDAPTVLVRDGNAILQRWDVPADDRWFAPIIPDDPKLLGFRRAIRDAGAALARPIADAPPARTDEERELWRREDTNAELASSRVRPVHCLDAALFAYQHARYDELTRPTELIAMVLRKDVDGRPMLRIYFAGSDVMFPPKTVYGLDAAARDVADGWRLAIHLHNHTIKKRGDRPALGVPAPSTSDVQFLRHVRDDLHVESVWVTNGFYTAEVPASALDRYQTRP
jgi:hypothetical protein